MAADGRKPEGENDNVFQQLTPSSPHSLEMYFGHLWSVIIHFLFGACSHFCRGVKKITSQIIFLIYFLALRAQKFSSVSGFISHRIPLGVKTLQIALHLSDYALLKLPPSCKNALDLLK